MNQFIKENNPFHPTRNQVNSCDVCHKYPIPVGSTTCYGCVGKKPYDPWVQLELDFQKFMGDLK